MDAILLAVASEKNRQCFGFNKALIEYDGRSLVKIAADALLESGCIDRLYVVGYPRELSCVSGCANAICNPVGNPIDNVINCIEKFDMQKEIMVVASDLPFISALEIKELYQLSKSSNADFYYPVINKTDFSFRFRKYKKTFIKVKDGRFTSGSVFIVKSEVAQRMREFGTTCVEKRKSPLQLAALMGVKNILLFLFGKISLQNIETIIKNKTRYDFQIVLLRTSGLVFDIDRKEQLDFLMKYEAAFSYPSAVQK